MLALAELRRSSFSGSEGLALEHETPEVCGVEPPACEVPGHARCDVGIEGTAPSPAMGPSSDVFRRPADDAPQPRLQTHGPSEAQGNALHPDRCTPCAFFCFKTRGCSKGAACNYCHGYHWSKQASRKLAWKDAQREKRLATKEKHTLADELEGSTPPSFSRQTMLDSRGPTEARDEDKLSRRTTEATLCPFSDASRVASLDTLASSVSVDTLGNLGADPMSRQTSAASSTAASKEQPRTRPGAPEALTELLGLDAEQLMGMLQTLLVTKGQAESLRQLQPLAAGSKAQSKTAKKSKAKSTEGFPSEGKSRDACPPEHAKKATKSRKKKGGVQSSLIEEPAAGAPEPKKSTEATFSRQTTGDPVTATPLFSRQTTPAEHSRQCTEESRWGSVAAASPGATFSRQTTGNLSRQPTLDSMPRPSTLDSLPAFSRQTTRETRFSRQSTAEAPCGSFAAVLPPATFSRQTTENLSWQPTLDSLPAFSRQTTRETRFSRQSTAEAPWGSFAAALPGATFSRQTTEDLSQQPTLDSLPAFSRQTTREAKFSRQGTEEAPWGSFAGPSATRMGQPRSQDFSTSTPTFSRQTTREAWRSGSLSPEGSEASEAALEQVDPLVALAEAEKTLAALRAVADSPQSKREQRKQLQAQADRCLALINSCFDTLGGGDRPEEAAEEAAPPQCKGSTVKGVKPFGITDHEPFYIGTSQGCPIYQKTSSSRT